MNTKNRMKSLLEDDACVSFFGRQLIEMPLPLRWQAELFLSQYAEFVGLCEQQVQQIGEELKRYDVSQN